MTGALTGPTGSSNPKDGRVPLVPSLASTTTSSPSILRLGHWRCIAMMCVLITMLTQVARGLCTFQVLNLFLA